MIDEKAAKVERFLNWIAPEARLESLGAESSVLEGIDEMPWVTEAEIEGAREAVARLERGENISLEQADAVEAIVLPKERPVVDIVNGTYPAPPTPFQHLGETAFRQVIENATPSIGRIDLPDHPSLPYGGTGFVVGDGLLMTNRHVADLFAVGIGREELSFRPELSAAVDFLRERNRDETKPFRIARVAMVHPYWDAALLVVEGLDGVPALRLSAAPPDDLDEREIAVIGYPALDPRNNVDLQDRIFDGVFNVKRLQPGKVRGRADIRSFGNIVSALTHDSSTLGGNSGSAVIDLGTGAVVALHFAGRYLEANFAVPTHELARDRRVVEAGVNFDDEIAGATTIWDEFWNEADPPASAPAVATVPDESGAASVAGAAPAVGEGQAFTWSIPLQVTVQISSEVAARLGGDTTAPDAGFEALVEPFRDEDFSTRSGYDERFLGKRVRLPSVRDTQLVSRLDDGSHVLPYEHFSIAINKRRRLALFAASNVDAAPERKKPEQGRNYSRRGLTGLRTGDKEKWYTDPRIPALHQLPDRFFTKDRESFDKGHIVRREDVAWGGSFDEVRRANGDTYHVTNCSPQAANFNRSSKKGVWGQLENLILNQAKTEQYSLFAGPVFRDDDPFFRGVDDEGSIHIAIPRQFWKIVVARAGDDLATFAFVLDQDLSHTDLEFAVDEPWRTRMLSVPNLEKLVGVLSFPKELHKSDQFGVLGGEAVREETRMETFAG